jgi:phosphoribosylformylglycinamidine cyclo-ligase
LESGFYTFLEVEVGDYANNVIKPGDRASRFARDICYQSHTNCKAIHVVPHEPGNFRGPVGVTWRHELLWEMSQYSFGSDGRVSDWRLVQGPENDGAGGKPQFWTFLGMPEVFYGGGWELIAMTADDLARTGRFPCYISSNEVNVQRLTDKNFPLFQAFMEGYAAALRRSGLANITGEVAVMRQSITAFCDIDSDEQLILTWGGTCIGLTRRHQLIDPSTIKPGLAIVGFHERGYRCNGGTFLTKVLMHRFGSDIRRLLENPDAREFVGKLIVPSMSYAKTISRLNGWNEKGGYKDRLVRFYGIAHITGGGVPGKFGEILPNGVGAVLNNMPTPPEVLLQAQEFSQSHPDPEMRMTDNDAYSTLHGGCGMLLMVEPSDADKVIEEAIKDGIPASVVGETVASENSKVIVHSRFMTRRALPVYQRAA